ncbi:Rieske (2Fe-2S) protein [Ancylobacter mangrovi]|uniref:Rieske (2Fe-2S) protein n=1 Tax=Ancylobacter mangrovi TaxID=2972472 RepID=A0A9X2T370_9HYPH|nr:Rieske (2Fe-2S) protein [Ancylobacter mangrovi]MCS0494646.1 Rieske (2Fe-2S) protein [Ancylobacter mangrovi]MCS0502047.1 Rieske (2Fe-2S) protein [Ancylobacter mangrovi]
MARFVVAKVGEIPRGEQKVVRVKGREILLLNVDDEYAALLNRCPHEGAKLLCGARVGLLESDEPGRFSYTRQGEFLRCPWHGWEFEIRTGQSWCDPKDTRIKNYDVKIEPGESLAKGPYVAESFPVHVEDSYIVIYL